MLTSTAPQQITLSVWDDAGVGFCFKGRVFGSASLLSGVEHFWVFCTCVAADVNIERT